MVPLAQGTVRVDVCDAWVFDEFAVHYTRQKTTAWIVAKPRRGYERQFKSTRLSKLTLPPKDGLVVDHINGNPFDNRRCNLRLVSPQENCRNRAKSPGKTSAYKGVSRKNGRWYAVIYHDYRQIFIGSFDCERSAAEAYDAKAREVFGDAGAFNFPLPGEQSALRTRTKIFHEADNG